jgi:hypothetical protein
MLQSSLTLKLRELKDVVTEKELKIGTGGGRLGMG